MPRSPTHRQIRDQGGFSLLEAIVAMVLVASVGVALFGWINSNIVALVRIQDVNARTEATTNILEFMGTINPMLAPEGRASFGSYQIGWQAKPVTDVVDRLTGIYQFALFRTRITVEKGTGEAWFDLSLQQVGFRKVRPPPGTF